MHSNRFLHFNKLVFWQSRQNHIRVSKFNVSSSTTKNTTFGTYILQGENTTFENITLASCNKKRRANYITDEDTFYDLVFIKIIKTASRTFVFLTTFCLWTRSEKVDACFFYSNMLRFILEENCRRNLWNKKSYDRIIRSKQKIL